MSDLSRKAQEALKNEDVQEAARILAKYDLGIYIPHMHDGRTGEVIPLPDGTVSCERDLTVSFESAADMGEDMLPVAWRWNTSGFEVCASCCATAGPT